MKSNNPLISVIIPIYKVEEYLSECVESIIAQSYKNLEIILVDDGSPDNCPVICDDYAKKDERIKVVHKKNGGLSDARNAGLNVATGKYVCFVDSDDYVAPDFIKRLLEALEKNDADMSVCKYKIVLPDNSKRFDESPKSGVLSVDDYWQNVFSGMYTTFVVAWNKLYKMDIFKTAKYAKGKINEDQIILHEILDKCQKVAVIDEALYYYRKREDSITGGKKKTISADAYEGLLERASYFLEKKKYNFCTAQIHALLGETTSRKQAKKYAGQITRIAKSIPKKYMTRGLKAKVFALRFAPGIYSLKRAQ